MFSVDSFNNSVISNASDYVFGNSPNSQKSPKEDISRLISGLSEI
jgi:hypothetical protein